MANQEKFEDTTIHVFKNTFFFIPAVIRVWNFSVEEKNLEDHTHP